MYKCVRGPLYVCEREFVCVCACAAALYESRCVGVSYNGRPKGTAKNRGSGNSKAFFGFYYRDIAKGERKTEAKEGKRNVKVDDWHGEVTGEQRWDVFFFSQHLYERLYN